MPSLAEYLHDFVRQAQIGASDFERELREVEARKQEIEGKLHLARLAAQRAGAYIPISGLTRYCPRCCVFDGHIQAELRSVPSDDRRIDLYRCNICEYEYEIET